jgi:hypothetical protein
MRLGGLVRGLTYVGLIFLASCEGTCTPDPPPLAAEICVAAYGLSTGSGDYEPNDDLIMATAPPAGTTSCANAALQSTISGATDIDVFRTGFCPQGGDPVATLVDGDPSLRMCLFAACNFGTTNVYGCYETEVGDSDTQTARDQTTVMKGKTDAGFTGCCRTGVGRLALQVQCSGFRSQALEGYVWIENANTDDNDHPYTISYSMQ